MYSFDQVIFGGIGTGQNRVKIPSVLKRNEIKLYIYISYMDIHIQFQLKNAKQNWTLFKVTFGPEMEDTGPGPVPISASRSSKFSWIFVFFRFSSIDLICLLRTRGSW